MKSISLKIYLPELKFYWILMLIDEILQAWQLLQNPVSSPTAMLKLFGMANIK
jgi:hypothetical protein